MLNLIEIIDNYIEPLNNQEAFKMFRSIIDEIKKEPKEKIIHILEEKINNYCLNNNLCVECGSKNIHDLNYGQSHPYGDTVAVETINAGYICEDCGNEHYY